VTPPVAVLGASIGGLSTALFLARAGHEVVLIDRDPATATPRMRTVGRARDLPVRRATPQAAHSHIFLAGLRSLLVQRAPDVLEVMLADGVREIAMRDGAPPTIVDRDHPALTDPELIALASRRTTLEESLRSVVLAEPNVRILPGRTVTGLIATDRTVRGVVLDDASRLMTDVVVDATGRRTALPSGLADHGSTPELFEQECGISYLSRFYRSADPRSDPPLTRGFTSGGSFDGWSCLVFPGDDGAFSVTFGMLPEDRDLRGLIDPDAFDAAVAAIPALAPWIERDRARPIGDVAVMSGMKNRVRRYRRDGDPVVLGVLAVGDAAATSNPAHSRGCTLAVVHAAATADAIDAHRGDLAALNAAADAIVDRQLQPWVDDSVEQDAVRLARWRPGSPPAPSPRPDRLTNGELYGAAQFDPVLWRAFTRMQNLLVTPDEVLADPAIVHAVRTGVRPASTPMVAPTRAELIELIRTSRRAQPSRRPMVRSA
jgi:2-polyprenyl-6-methoxyphenol hydroxylase-like FAD-dependent oxidoreductase